MAIIFSLVQERKEADPELGDYLKEYSISVEAGTPKIEQQSLTLEIKSKGPSLTVSAAATLEKKLLKMVGISDEEFAGKKRAYSIAYKRVRQPTMTNIAL